MSAMMIPMATVVKVTNGYLVRYHAPFQRERVLPSQVPPGLFSAQAAVALAIRSGDEDEELVGAGAYEASKRQEREERVRKEVAQVEQRLANQKVTQWVLEEQSYLAATLADVFTLMQQADAAQTKALDLLRSGVVLHGMTPGSMITPA